jgi:hypothetical protein
MFFQVFVTVLAIINYISLTYIVNQDEGVYNILIFSGSAAYSKGLGFIIQRYLLSRLLFSLLYL